jgi:hypothetical protein
MGFISIISQTWLHLCTVGTWDALYVAWHGGKSHQDPLTQGSVYCSAHTYRSDPGRPKTMNISINFFL